MNETSIEWTDSTWNPIRGCSRISAGCVNCYAERQAARFVGPGQHFEGFATQTPSGPRWTGKLALIPKRLPDPLEWLRPRRIFVNSMSDLFHESLSDEEIDRVFAVMAIAQRHTFQVLTKRAERMHDYCSRLTPERLRVWINRSADGGEHRPGAPNLCSIDARSSKRRFMDGENNAIGGRTPPPPLPNVWIGVSVEDQASANERIPFLLRTPAAVRFLSVEPLLERISLFELLRPRVGSKPWLNGAAIDWVIVGGESGPGARPCMVEWVRSIVDQCQTVKVSLFVKQLGANVWAETPKNLQAAGCRSPYGVDLGPHKKGGDPKEWPEDLRVREFPT